jgi:nitrate/nitrite transport system permease protein
MSAIMEATLDSTLLTGRRGLDGPGLVPGQLDTVPKLERRTATVVPLPARLVRPPSAIRPPRRVASLLATVGWASVGIGAVIAFWWIGSARVADLPSPIATFRELGNMLSDPFRNGGPNDQGVGLQLLSSLGRVARGFGLAVVVGVPCGLMIGASKRAWAAANPVIQLLRPVSPLAWFPIWLITVKNAPKAAVIVIFITALWPIIVNTASGAATVPQDQRHVAKVFKFSRRTYVRHVLLPNALPSVVTGMRLSMGVAWMVIVAVEMLSGGSGIGFFVWDAYNALNLSRVIAAIILIGGIGFALDLAFLRLGRKVALPGMTPA